MAKTVEVIPARRTPRKPKAEAVRPSEVRYIELPPEDERAPELYDALDLDGGGKPDYVDAALAGVMADLGASDEDAKVTVWRVSAVQGTRKQEWLFECHPREFSIPQLQADFGAGEYRVRVYGKQEGTNYRVVHADKRINIGEARGAVKKETALGAMPAAIPQDISKSIADALAAPLSALAQIVAGSVKQAPTRAQMLAELREMREIFGPSVNAAPADPFAALRSAIELVKQAQPAPSIVNDDGEVSPTALIAKGIDVVQHFFEAARGNAGAQPSPEALPAPGQAAAVPMQPNPAAPVPSQSAAEDEMGLYLKTQLKMLLHAARSGADTSLYSELIYQQAPDEVIAILQSDQWFAELVKLEPGFAAVKPWAEKVRAEVMEALDEETHEAQAAALTPESGKGINGADGSGPEPTAH